MGRIKIRGVIFMVSHGFRHLQWKSDKRFQFVHQLTNPRITKELPINDYFIADLTKEYSGDFSSDLCCIG